MKKYKCKELSELVSKNVLEKTKKTKLELLNDVIYCIVGVDCKRPLTFDGTAYLINKKTREKYEGKILDSLPIFYSKREYVYEEYHRDMLNRCYLEKHNKNSLYFDNTDIYLFDEIIEYIIASEIAPEIISQIEHFTKPTLIEKLAADIIVYPSINMTRFCYVSLYKTDYCKLKDLDSIINYISDKVIEILQKKSLLVSIDINSLEPKKETRRQALLMIEELSFAKKKFENLLENEFLKKDPRAQLALQALEISLSNLSEVTSHLS